MRKAFLILIGFYLSACTHYLKPLCDESNRVDVPNLEGRFSTTLVSLEKAESQIMRMTLTISRIDRGIYSVYQESEPTELFVCRIGGHLYVEGKSKPITDSSPETIQVFRLDPLAGGSFDLVFLGVDSQYLKSRGIPYQVIVKEPPKEEPQPGPVSGASIVAGNSTSAVVIDNSNIKASDFVQFLDPLSLKLTWLAAPPAP